MGRDQSLLTSAPTILDTLSAILGPFWFWIGIAAQIVFQNGEEVVGQAVGAMALAVLFDLGEKAAEGVG